jgi:HPt (histidine-containing phosphotransfer) domain-containing protein
LYLAGSTSAPRPDSDAQTLRNDPGALDPEIRLFLPSFIDNLPAQVAELQKTLDANDLSALADVAHKLKGSGGMYGFDLISRHAAEVEQSLRDGALDSLARQVVALIDLVRRVEGYDKAKENNHVGK